MIRRQHNEKDISNHSFSSSHADFREVDRRMNSEQGRINQGIRSGALTTGEAARLDRREGFIRGEVAADRAANGGRLTGQEWRQVNRQENRLSRSIYWNKHNWNYR